MKDWAEFAEGEAIEVVRHKNRRQAAEIHALAAEVAGFRKKLEVFDALDNVRSNAPLWLAPKARPKDDRGIANLLLSDLHLDEVVAPEQILGMNSFNRKIAEMRLRRCFERFILVARDHLNGIQYDGAVVWLGGDIFSGNIHEELKETNEAPILESLDFWIDPMVAGLRMVAEHFGKVHLPGVVGNHGRNTRKPVHKNRVPDNFDWFFYRVLARELADDKRFTFQISDAADTVVDVYDRKYLFTHGDQFRGGSGIGGVMIPIMRGDAKKRNRQQAVNSVYDRMILGHFHTYWSGMGLIVNGALKGYDEYAFDNNFGFEPPQQAFWVNTPQHGVTFSAPILCQDRKREGW